MDIKREAVLGGEIYHCADCGVVVEENYYPEDLVGTAASALWENNREEAVKLGISYSGFNPCDCC